MALETLKEWWFLVIALVATLVFALRTEARTKQNTERNEATRNDMEKALNELARQRQEDLRLAEKSREETNAVLREMRDDQRAAAKTLQEFLAIIIKNQHHPGE